MLHVILLDSALELVPSEISALKEIQRYASRKGKKPGEILLDQTHHGRSMTRLDEHRRRGRPDIVYLSLMTLLETPLCKEGHLSVHIHCQDGRIIELDRSVRLPRNYDRFVGLFEQLLSEGAVPPDGPPLLRITGENLSQLLDRIHQKSGDILSILAAEDGESTTIADFEAMLPSSVKTPVAIGIGAFPHGDMSSEIKSLFDRHLRLDSDMMMAWHVCAEAVWVYSKRVGVIEERFGL